jgi:peptide/nickel transport system permease protein
MLGLIVRRVLLMGMTALVVSALLFFTITQLLGSPAEMMLGQDASPAAIAALNAAYGFDQPALRRPWSARPFRWPRNGRARC